MRTAALPNFRKLYRKIDHENNGEDFKDGLPEGVYSLDIEYSKNLALRTFHTIHTYLQILGFILN